MRKYKSQGGEGMNKPIIIGKDHIYLHTNIQECFNKEGQKHYTYDVEKIPLNEAIGRLTSNDEDIKMALAELAIIIGGD